MASSLAGRLDANRRRTWEHPAITPNGIAAPGFWSGFPARGWEQAPQLHACAVLYCRWQRACCDFGGNLTSGRWPILIVTARSVPGLFFAGVGTGAMLMRPSLAGVNNQFSTTDAITTLSADSHIAGLHPWFAVRCQLANEHLGPALSRRRQCADNLPAGIQPRVTQSVVVQPRHINKTCS